MIWILKKFEHLESTNTFLYDVTRVGTVVVAKQQSAGRGRGENTWNSPEGGLYFSVLLSCEKGVHVYPLIAALSVRDALLEFNIDCKIKWPNDLLFEGKKVCGILCEKKGEHIIVGIGVNTGSVLSDFPSTLQATSITLREKRLDNDEVLQKILTHLNVRLKLSNPLQDYEKNCVTIGKEIILHDGTSGRACGLTRNGCLQIETVNGLTEIISPIQIKN